jgi:hypothetical protein
LGEITAGPDGNLWFVDGNNLGQVTPDGNITEIAVPPKTGFSPQLNGGITAGPDGNIWFTSSIGIGQFVLDGITAVPTFTNLDAPELAIAGQPVTFTATVTSSAGAPTGTVAFFDNGAFLGSVSLDAAGQASLTTSLDVGFHAVSALYVGTPDFSPSGDIRGVQVDSSNSPNAPGTTASSVLSNQIDGLVFAAAVDVLFVRVQLASPSAGPDVEHAGVATVATASPASQSEPAPALPVRQAVDDAGAVHYLGDGADASNATGLADGFAPNLLNT